MKASSNVETDFETEFYKQRCNSGVAYGANDVKTTWKTLLVMKDGIFVPSFNFVLDFAAKM